MAPATVGHVSRSAGPDPDPAPAATTALTRSGCCNANCKTAYPPMLNPTTWAAAMASPSRTANKSSTANCQPYCSGSSGTADGG